MPAFTKNFTQLPNSIKDLIQYAIEKVHPEQVVLFGSRARGDHREKSDFDIAMKGSIAPEAWTQLQVELDEKALSLYSVDLVLYQDLGEDYRKNIQVEGKVIYG
ncbi:MAG TPA: nucleotidyltransferase domain-containing protein [Pseudobdellovibrionaceae bacterium]|jgi:predicted nucleotidyltransferase